jgi:hypothetical protein
MVAVSTLMHRAYLQRRCWLRQLNVQHIREDIYQLEDVIVLQSLQGLL